MTLVPTTPPSAFSPLEEQFHVWDIIIVNPPVAGVAQTKAITLWATISITDTFEGIRTTVELNAEEPAIPYIRELITDFVFLRDHVKLYRLRVVDSEDVLTRDAASVRFDCVSYDKLLERRILHEDWVLDDYDINAAWRLIDYTQRKQTLGITRGTTLPGSRRQRGLDAGDDILTAVNDFAQADNGFDWWIDAELKFWAVKPRRGKPHDDLHWAYGAEVAEVVRMNPIEDYSSLVMATGAQSEVRIPRPDGEEDVYPPPSPQIAQLTTKPLGLWELTSSDTDVITDASLREKALWHLADKGSIRPTYKITLEPGVWTPDVALGDTLVLRINSVRANVKVPIRIEEIQITATADGAEAISMAVRAEEPETPITFSPLTPLALASGAPAPNGRTVQRHRLDPADDLGAILRSLRKRLDRIERSPGVGAAGGSIILDGEGPPPPEVGAAGDYYVDTIGQWLYGPKGEGDWGSESLLDIPATMPDTHIAGEVGCRLDIYGRGRLVGWRYRRLATSTSPMTFTVWRIDSLSGPDVTKLIEVTVDDDDTGEYEVRLDTPIYLDALGIDGPNGVMIAAGGDAVPYRASGALAPIGDEDWFTLSSRATHTDVIGDCPIAYIPGFPSYPTFLLFPIVQEEIDLWPLSNVARSGDGAPEAPRVELRHNIGDVPAAYGDRQGLHFYPNGGPSHDWEPTAVGERLSYPSAFLFADETGAALYTDDWFDEGEVPRYFEDLPDLHTERWSQFAWYNDWSYTELDTFLDPLHPTVPGSSYTIWTEQNTWDWFAFVHQHIDGPRYGHPVDGEPAQVAEQSGVGFTCDITELRDSGMAAVARMYVIGSDGQAGTSLQVTPHVIQACFPPNVSAETWMAGTWWAAPGLTPRGCVSPLVTAATAGATIADEPWSKQFLRQIGTTAVVFTGGVGTITTPTPMDLPAVVNAQVQGVSVGGPRVAQAERTALTTITLALDSAVDGTVSINWTVEHARHLYAAPPPAIEIARDPAGFLDYGNNVDYDAGGGPWPFELISWGYTFQDGCILRDLSGATVGGPFTPEDYDFGGGRYQRVIWSAERNWYPPGTSQHYQMVNPDGQTSSWYPIFWLIPNPDEFRAAARVAPRSAEEPPIDRWGRPLGRRAHGQQKRRRSTDT